MRPWKVITTSNPDQTLGEGEFRHYRSLLDAANAFAKARAPFQQIVFDDGCDVRFLTDQEQAFLEDVCRIHGYDVEDIDADTAMP